MGHWVSRFCSWLEQTSFSQALQSFEWIIPTVQTVHILSIALVMSAVLVIDLRLMGLAGRDQSLARISNRFSPFIWRTLPILFATGVLMIIAEPARSLQNPVFQLKMALLVAAIAVSLCHQLPLRNDSGHWDESKSRKNRARILGALSLALWVGIVFSGRWIAYVQGK